MGRVFVVGSSNIDHVIEVGAFPRPGETVLGTRVRLFPGGKGANQAVAAARDGGNVVFVGAVGDDEGGRMTLDALRLEGVDPAPARDLSVSLLACAPILTPNAQEAADLTGMADPEQAARRLSERSGTWAIVTLGGDGVLVAHSDHVQHVPAHEAHVVDTTGAGDTFAGVLSAALARGADVPTAVRRANAAASLSVAEPGARDGMPHSSVIDLLLSGGSAT